MGHLGDIARFSLGPQLFQEEPISLQQIPDPSHIYSFSFAYPVQEAAVYFQQILRRGQERFGFDSFVGAQAFFTVEQPSSYFG